MAEITITIIGRKDAIARRLKRYFTGKPCKRGHVSERFSVSKCCVECHNKLVAVDLNKHRANFRRWYAKNVDWQRTRMRAARANNIDARRVAELLHKKLNPEKYSAYQRNRIARQKNASGQHTADDIAAIYKAQRGKCAYFKVCRTHLKKRYHVDHIHPLSKGGGNGRENLQLLCVKCNCTKHARDPIDFVQSLGMLI